MSTIKWNRILKSVMLTTVLPILFVVHNIQETFPYFSLKDFISFLSLQLLVSIILWSSIHFILRKEDKSVLLTFLLLSVYFFFSSFHQQLKIFFGESMITKYRYLVPLLLFILFVLVYFIIRTKYSVNKLVSYLALVFSIFIFIDIALILYKYVSPIQSGTVRVNRNNPINLTICDTCKKPDIYFLIFDEYSGSSTLKKNFGFDNSGFEDFLRTENFKISGNSHSNYYYTLFCMASMLNMSYLDGSPESELKFEDMASAQNLIKYSNVIEGLKKHGYAILNYSSFDILSNPHTVNFSHFIGPAEAMKLSLFHNRLWKDIGWNFGSAADTLKYSAYIDSAIAVYQQTYNGIKQASIQSSAVPRFIYGHFFIPHAPFIFDSVGNRRTIPDIYADSSSGNFVRSYLNYLPFVNRQIKEIITTIKKNSGGKSVIVAMGDHGLRVVDYDHAEPFYFRNFNAVYLPEFYKGTAFYDSISGVNQFRALFNELFHMKIPFDKDSICWRNEKYISE